MPWAACQIVFPAKLFVHSGFLSHISPQSPPPSQLPKSQDAVEHPNHQKQRHNPMKTLELSGSRHLHLCLCRCHGSSNPPLESPLHVVGVPRPAVQQQPLQPTSPPLPRKYPRGSSCWDTRLGLSHDRGCYRSTSARSACSNSMIFGPPKDKATASRICRENGQARPCCGVRGTCLSRVR